MSAVISGALLGLSVAAPFGPVSLMCVQRSLLSGIWRGMASGAGAATAHGLYAATAMMSADIVAGTLTRWHLLVQLLSATVLIALGVRTMARRAAAEQPVGLRASGSAAYTAGLLLALSNPMTILPYAALASGVAAIDPGKGLNLGWMVAGIILGTVSWYAALSSSAWLLSKHLPQRVLSRLNWFAGAVLIGFGLLILTR
jgi:threonine/homoserine/homoserine lactone efflux protein